MLNLCFNLSICINCISICKNSISALLYVSVKSLLFFYICIENHVNNFVFYSI